MYQSLLVVALPALALASSSSHHIGSAHLSHGKSEGGVISLVNSMERRNDETDLVLDPALIQAQFPTPEAVQKYEVKMSRPSPYLEEYYGLHVLQPVKKEDVIRDFGKPTEAPDSQGDSIILELWGKGNATFHFGKRLVRDYGAEVDSGHTYAWFATPNVDNLLSLLDSFHDSLEKRKLSDKYLIKSIHFDLEKSTMDRLRKSDDRVPMTEDPDRSKFGAAGPDALLAVPDALHGDIERYKEIVDILEKEKIDWFGIEMYRQDMQSTIDTYLSKPEGSPEFKSAKKELLETSWNNFADQQENPEDNYYLRLIDICRKRKVRVYGLDVDPVYNLFAHGETPFGGMVRSSFWAQPLPSSGRAVLFGGSMHFQGAGKVQGHPSLFVQDFLPTTYRGDKLLVFPTK